MVMGMRRLVVAGVVGVGEKHQREVDVAVKGHPRVLVLSCVVS